MHFPVRAASILFLFIFGYKIDVLKSSALFQGKELQVTRFKVTCFWFQCLFFDFKCSDWLTYRLSAHIPYDLIWKLIAPVVLE